MLFLSPLGHSSAQIFLSGQARFHIPVPPHLPVFPLLVSVQSTSGQLSMLLQLLSDGWLQPAAEFGTSSTMAITLS